MTGQLNYDANLARLNDLRRQSDRRAVVRGITTRHAAGSAGTRQLPQAEEPIAIRRATDMDRAALERLAALDSAKAPSGEVLIALSGDEPQAAIEIATGAAIADPFRATAHLIELLSTRAARLRHEPRSHRRLRLRTRSAWRAA